jgi:hypothetical protein
MKEDEYTVPDGPFKGKKIELASTNGIDRFEEIAEDSVPSVQTVDWSRGLGVRDQPAYQCTSLDPQFPTL